MLAPEIGEALRQESRNVLLSDSATNRDLIELFEQIDFNLDLGLGTFSIPRDTRIKMDVPVNWMQEYGDPHIPEELLGKEGVAYLRVYHKHSGKGISVKQQYEEDRSLGVLCRKYEVQQFSRVNSLMRIKPVFNTISTMKTDVSRLVPITPPQMEILLENVDTAYGVVNRNIRRYSRF